MPNDTPTFWDFSLELYERDGVANACLEMQSQYDFDVNLVLACFWLGSNFGVVEEQLFSELLDFSTHWQKHVVRPLRNSRTWLKKQAKGKEKFAELRERIKADELAAEKHQQDHIQDLAIRYYRDKEQSPSSAAILTNFKMLLSSMNLEWDLAIEERIAVILAALERKPIY